MRVLASLIVSGLLAASAQAALLNSFENQANGWAAIAGYSTTTGVTEGSYSAMVNVPTGWSNGPFKSGWSPNLLTDLAAGDTIYMDVTPSFPVPAGCHLQIAWQLQQANGTGTGDVGYMSVNATGTTTVSYAYAGAFTPDLSNLTAAGGWANVSVVTNVGGVDPGTGLAYVPGTVYFDNFRVGAVPEPASLGLLRWVAYFSGGDDPLERSTRRSNSLTGLPFAAGRFYLLGSDAGPATIASCLVWNPRSMSVSSMRIEALDTRERC